MIVYEQRVDVPNYRDGQPACYSSGQQMVTRMVLQVGSEYHKPREQDTNLLLSVGVSLDRQTALLNSSQVADLRNLLCDGVLVVPLYAFPAEAQGTRLEVARGPRPEWPSGGRSTRLPGC